MATRSILQRFVVLATAALSLALLALVAAAPAFAQQQLRGVALVIGNSEYEHLPVLANPQSDARAIEELLSDLGFETELSSDRDARRLARELDTFAEDAEGADVAVLYYAGHGIEAGGENFLVPVDADLSALDAAGEKLVPIGDHIRRLRETVAVTIVLLDACRDNPFPPGARLKLAPDAAPQPVAAAGLALPDTRGAAPLSRAAKPQADGSLGIVVGFAAEPGKPALDGKPGENSPYAAAVLKHLSAMAGSEFGQVMRMVGEEVYLRTGGAQRPWVNESLRRLLYFGEAPQEPAGAEGDILRERRQLLLTIADLPDLERQRVERVAAEGAVPMDAIYAVLKALGQQIPDDPTRLEALLRRQAEDLRSFLDDRRTITNPDPELARLAALTDRAVAEGAIAAARAFREQADRRIEELSSVVDREEENIRARRTEFAAEYARSAEIAALAFRHLEAAGYYRKAYAQVEKWDDDLAWQYRFAEVEGLHAHGNFQGDNSTLLRAIQIGEQALDLVAGNADRDRWADMQQQIGLMLRELGVRAAGIENLARAESAFRLALTVRSRERTPTRWADTQLSLATVLAEQGMRETGTVRLEQAIEALELTLTVYTRSDYPVEWAISNSNLGNILLALAQRRGGAEYLREAVARLHSALLEQTREATPQFWADNQNNLGLAFMRLGGHEVQTQLLEMAVERFQAALLERSRERTPLRWAQTQMNLGATLINIGTMKPNPVLLRAGIDTLYLSLEAYTREQDAPLWGLTHVALASGYLALGTLRNDPDTIEQAVVAARKSLEVLVIDDFPFEWTAMQQTLAKATFRVGQLRQDQPLIDAALAGLREAIARIPKPDLPEQWIAARNTEAEFLLTTGQLRADAAPLGEAVEAYEEILALLPPDISWAQKASVRSGLGRALYLRGLVTNDEAAVRRSVDELGELTESIDRQRAPLVWAAAYQFLGDSFLWLGASRTEPKLVNGAIAAYGLALQEFEPDATPADWAVTRGSLAYANVVAGAFKGDRAGMVKGIADLEATRDRTRASGLSRLDAFFDRFLAVAAQLLAQQPAEKTK